MSEERRAKSGESKPPIRARWQSPCGRAQLILGDARQLVSSLTFDALISDPPYGINYRHGGGDSHTRTGRINGRVKAHHRAKLKPIPGDDRPFDPRPFITKKPSALFGANFYAEHLPRGHWSAWDKRGGGRGADDDFADAEFIWSTYRLRRNLFPHLWKGLCCDKIGEERKSCKRLHQSQKPVRVMQWIIEGAKLPPGSVILDPFLGSGTTGIAALRLGHCFIGVEIDRENFAIARTRLADFLNSPPLALRS